MEHMAGGFLVARFRQLVVNHGRHALGRSFHQFQHGAVKFLLGRAALQLCRQTGHHLYAGVAVDRWRRRIFGGPVAVRIGREQQIGHARVDRFDFHARRADEGLRPVLADQGQYFGVVDAPELSQILEPAVFRLPALQFRAGEFGCEQRAQRVDLNIGGIVVPRHAGRRCGLVFSIGACCLVVHMW